MWETFLPACFSMGRYLCLEPIFPVAMFCDVITCKPYRESSNKESETECKKILSSPLWMPTTSSNNPSNAVDEQWGVTRPRPAGNIKNNFFSVLGGCKNGERFCQPKQQAKVTSYKSSFSFHKNLQNQIIVVQFDNKNAKTPNLSWYNDRKKFSKKKMQLLTHLWLLLMPICFLAIATWPICISYFIFPHLNILTIVLVFQVSLVSRLVCFSSITSLSLFKAPMMIYQWHHTKRGSARYIVREVCVCVCVCERERERERERETEVKSWQHHWNW